MDPSFQWRNENKNKLSHLINSQQTICGGLKKQLHRNSFIVISLNRRVGRNQFVNFVIWKQPQKKENKQASQISNNFLVV